MNKRLLLADAMRMTGLGAITRRLHRDAVLVFNYRRIRPDRDGAPCLFDEGVFGPAQSEFRKQIAYLRKATTILREDDLLRILDKGGGERRLYSLITFDGAYSDNYHLALPVLEEMRAPAIFFVPFTAVETRTLGWRDRIAFMVKQMRKIELRFRDRLFILPTERKSAIAYFFSLLMNLTPAEETASLLEELAEAAEVPLPGQDLMDGELMTWEQLRAARERGIAAGSHICSHRVLAALPEVEQREKLLVSKALLEERLAAPVRTIAYPAEGPAQFSAAIRSLAGRAGYCAGFSSNAGFGYAAALDRFAIPRMAAPDTASLMRAAVNFPKLMGRARA